MVSVQFAAKSFFPICPEIKKMDSQFCSETNTQKQNGSIPDQNIQKM